jgi:hypothetical protein
MSDDEEYEYDYGSDAEYDYGSDGGNENEENEGADDGVIEIENSFYGTNERFPAKATYPLITVLVYRG